MSDLALNDFAQRLAAYEPGDGQPGQGLHHAAVAALLRPADDELLVLLMQRVEHPDDRWSGQICLPGGGADATDADLLATARRETREELGVDLAVAQLLCRFERIQAVASEGQLPMQISPYVFTSGEDVAVELGVEAAGAFWFPLGRALSGELDDSYRFTYEGVERLLPCWRYDGHVVWGMTHRMLSRVLTVAATAPQRRD